VQARAQLQPAWYAHFSCEVTLRKQILTHDTVWQGTWGGDKGYGHGGMGMGLGSSSHTVTSLPGLC
jgi:hypothetical protein